MDIFMPDMLGILEDLDVHPYRCNNSSQLLSTKPQPPATLGVVRGERASMVSRAVTNQARERRVGRSPGVDPTATELAGGMTKYRCPFSSGRCVYVGGFDHLSAIMKDSFVVQRDLELFQVCDVHLGVHLTVGPAACHALSLHLSSLETC